ncbi:MAG TPA: hypothetical protein VF167_11235 [Longimicrobiaceae bacterium]
MKREALRFWGSAVAVAVAWAVIAPLVLPYEALGLESAAARGRAWLLTLWTSGVMSICFGAAGLLGYVSPIGFKEVAEAGSLMQAIEARRRARREGSFHQNFAWWLIVTGLLLIAIYFVVWGATHA